MTTNEERRLVTAAHLAALTLANAFIAQAELAEVDARVRPLRETLAQPDPVGAFQAHWEFIATEINYVPIFKLAREVLLQLPTRPELYQALRTLGEEVLAIVSERAALRHDLMGRIYHHLLLEAKYLGTFYTSVPSATLLLKLALAPEKMDNLDWSKVNDVRKLRVADLACGTGTLLMAAQQTMTDNYVRAAASAGHHIGLQEIRDLQRSLMEEVLYGYDVLASAVHLTASTLAMLAPEIALHMMHLYVVPLGEQPGGSVSLGSIEFLKLSDLPTQLSLMDDTNGTAGQSMPLAVTGTGDKLSSAPLPDLDLCVMNPPFVRSVGGNLLFGSLPKGQREKMQQKLSQMLNPHRKGVRPALASSTAGLGSVFVAVANPHIKPGGRIALVLPAALAFGVAWDKTRQLLSEEYVLEYLVISYDPDHWSFSENTELSEVLAIARKLKPGERVTDAKTTCVNLWRNTETPVAALAVADAILHNVPADVEAIQSPAIAPLDIDTTKLGEIVSVPWSMLKTGQWYGCAFAQTDLTRVSHFLRKGQIALPMAGIQEQIPLAPLSELGTLGPDRRDIYDGFSVGTSATSYPALWGHEADAMTKLVSEPNSYLTPLTTARAGRPLRRVEQLWPLAGTIMLAERMWLLTQRVTAVRMTKAALANVWWPLHLFGEDDALEKSLVLWLNSTLGLITVLSYRVPTRGSWIQFKKPLLEQTPVLDVRRLTTEQASILAKAYDAVAQTELAPLSQMAGDTVRGQIDAAIALALGLPSLDSLRLALAREPILSGVRL